ncbi:MAG: YciI family protein [Pseudomonadota bacterium]
MSEKCLLIHCRDGAQAAEKQTLHLDGHLAHVEQYWRSYVNAGPIKAPNNEAIIGSVFLVLAKDIQYAKNIMGGDPFISRGKYETIEYSEFINSIGHFIGGKIWRGADSLRSSAIGGAD